MTWWRTWRYKQRYGKWRRPLGAPTWSMVWLASYVTAALYALGVSSDNDWQGAIVGAATAAGVLCGWWAVTWLFDVLVWRYVTAGTTADVKVAIQLAPNKVYRVNKGAGNTDVTDWAVAYQRRWQ